MVCSLPCNLDHNITLGRKTVALAGIPGGGDTRSNTYAMKRGENCEVDK